MQALCQYRLGKLYPDNPDDLRKLKAGETYRVDIRRVRNARQFRLYWALMGVLATYAEVQCDPEDVSDWIKIAVGHCEDVKLPDGTVRTKPKSIAFGNLPQDQWEAFFNKVIDVACVKILHGTDNATLKRELEEMIGG